ncbi:beta-microseminoprotein E1-like [Discoglossus pictus]
MIRKDRYGYSMNLLVVAMLASALLVILCNASCYEEERMRMARPSLYSGCLGPDGEMHDDNSTWVKEDCMECKCRQHIISCCLPVGRPAMYKAEACEAILNRTTCKYELRKKENHTDPCTFMAIM